jgi:hypothetical protein
LSFIGKHTERQEPKIYLDSGRMNDPFPEQRNQKIEEKSADWSTAEESHETLLSIEIMFSLEIHSSVYLSFRGAPELP